MNILLVYGTPDGLLLTVPDIPNPAGFVAEYDDIVLSPIVLKVMPVITFDPAVSVRIKYISPFPGAVEYIDHR